MNVANEQMAYEINCDQTEPIQENQYTSSSATDFSFYNSQLFNPVTAPSERSLQMQSLNTFPDTMVTEKLLTLLFLPLHLNSQLLKLYIIPLCHSIRYSSA